MWENTKTNARGRKKGGGPPYVEYRKEKAACAKTSAKRRKCRNQWPRVIDRFLNFHRNPPFLRPERVIGLLETGSRKKISPCFEKNTNIQSYNGGVGEILSGIEGSSGCIHFYEPVVRFLYIFLIFHFIGYTVGTFTFNPFLTKPTVIPFLIYIFFFPLIS